MKNNKILIINHYAGAPKYGMRFRDYDISKELIKQGWEVCIIAATFSHLRSTPKCKSEIIDGIHYRWVKVPSYKNYGFSRLLNMLMFPLNLYFKIPNLPFTPDFVISSSPSPFTILNGIHLKRKFKAKFIYEIRDIWPLSITELKNVSKNHPLILFFDWLDNQGIKNAEAVLSPLANISSYLKGKGFNKKVIIAPNGIPLMDITAIPDSPKNEKFVIGYGGSLSDSNSIMNLINAAIILKDKSEILFRIVGSGERENDIINVIKEKELNVEYLGRVSKEEFFKIMKSCDILYKGNPKKELYKYGVSSIKMAEYLLLKKPIIDASYGVEIIKKAKIGITVEEENKEALVQGILELKMKDDEELREMGENGFKYAQDNFSYKNIVKNLIFSLNKL